MLSCNELTAPQNAQLVRVLTREVCAGVSADATRALTTLRALDGDLRCEGAREPVVSALQGRGANPAAVARALATEAPAFRRAVLARLDAERYATLLLGEQDAAGVYLVRLAASSWRPDLAAGRVLLRRRAALPVRAVARVAVIDLLARLPAESATTLRGEVVVAVDAGVGDDTSALRFALGDRGRYADVLRGASAGSVVWMSNDSGPNFTFQPETAVYAQALWLSGCEEGEVRRASEALLAGREPVACWRAPRWPRPTGQLGLWESEARRLAPR